MLDCSVLVADWFGFVVFCSGRAFRQIKSDYMGHSIDFCSVLVAFQVAVLRAGDLDISQS